MHRSWSLSDLKTMTPRQRKYWVKMGKVRQQEMQREMQAVIERGGVPIGLG